ncbi:hypothetical protein GN958_ATG14708 [Phytophthora infestans]|uniref:Uncharacterized protein n=1 Tax=Phytophthora infestans TaxID=4787 RepID=A0A8S9U968_PHYIN|nr:hypothetical protein GN958_ATG14708 [Phytophthora infestans]
MLIGGQQTTFNSVLTLQQIFEERMAVDKWCYQRHFDSLESQLSAYMAKPACELAVSNQQLSPSDKVETACSMVREAIKNNRLIFEQTCAENVELFKRTMHGCLELHKDEPYDFRAKAEQVLNDSRANFNQELKREVGTSSSLQSYSLKVQRAGADLPRCTVS